MDDVEVVAQSRKVREPSMGLGDGAPPQVDAVEGRGSGMVQLHCQAAGSVAPQSEEAALGMGPAVVSSGSPGLQITGPSARKMAPGGGRWNSKAAVSRTTSVAGGASHEQ
ncbi:Hypothetical predicted protein, partial [Pelobates cultripes]